MVGTMRKSPFLTSAEWSQIQHIGSPDALGFQNLQQVPKSVDAKFHFINSVCSHIAYTYHTIYLNS